MRIIEIAQFESSVVIHLETEDKRINAYTLASMLVALADAAKAANNTLNAGHDIEIVVEAIGPGSFRAQIRALYKKSKTLLKDQILIGVVIGVLGNYVYERTFAIDNQVSVQVNTDEVIIQRGVDRIVVPRNVYNATREVEKNPQFKKSMSEMFSAIANDKQISSIGLVKNMDSPPPSIPIPRSTIEALATEEKDDKDSRVITERAELQILKAILQKSRRKWEFVWRGINISARVIPDNFYKDFFAHQITIAPGDTLDVTLAIHQNKDPETGIFTNTGYDVLEVHRHTPRIWQLLLDDQKNQTS